MAHGPTFEPKNSVLKWTEERLPIFGLIHGSLGPGYPAPRNLNYWWNFGSLAGLCLVIQIITGIILAMHYTPHIDMAFDSVERITRDVNYGWLMRYMHTNGASMFFIAVYIHIFRGMYYGSYKAPREMLWMLGLVIMLLMMATAFMGYVLPWGQMSFWGATVITNFFSAFNDLYAGSGNGDGLGDMVVSLLLGGFSVDNPTLNRFYSLHYLLPFVITGVVILHIWALHIPGSNNPLGIDMKGKQDKIPFHPYYTAKDGFGVFVFLAIFAMVIFYAPDSMGHPDNYIPADPMVTPAHIVPEWYFLPFYTILKSFTIDFIITAKFWGVIAMFASIILLFFLPWLDSSKVRSAQFRPVFRFFFWVLLVDLVVLTWIGAKSADEIIFMDIQAVTIGQVATFWYFFHFFFLLPVLSRVEKTLPLPESIASAVIKDKA